MEKLKKIISILLIIIMIFYVNSAFATDITNEKFYDIIIKLNEGLTVKEWDGESYENSSSKSQISMSYSEFFEVRKEENKIIYKSPDIKDIEQKDLYSIEYNVDSGKFYATSCLDLKALEYLQEKLENSEESSMSIIAIAFGYAYLPVMCVIGLANITNVVPEDAYRYYNLCTNSPDEKNIFKIEQNETDEYKETKLEIDLEKFAKIDNTYFEDNTSCEIIYKSEDLNNSDNTDNKDENKSNNENTLNNTNTENKTNNNASKNENTNINTNTNKAQNINTNTKVSLEINSNKNNTAKNTNTQNMNTQNTNTKNKTDNSTSKIKLPSAGAYEVGFLIVSVCMIGLYSYKKYIDLF